MRILYTNVFLFIAVLFCILSPGNNPLHKYVEIKEGINNLSIHAHLRLLTEIMENGSLNGFRLNDKNGEHDEEEERKCDDDQHSENQEHECDNDQHSENQEHECDNEQNDESKCEESNNTDQADVNYLSMPIQIPYLRNEIMDDNYYSRYFDSNIMRTDEVTTRLNDQNLIEKCLCKLEAGKYINEAKIKYAEEIIDSMKLTDKVKDIFKEFMRYYIWKRYPSHQLRLYKKIKKDIEKYTRNHVICSLVDFETIEDELYYLIYPNREMYMSFDTAVNTKRRKKIKKLMREKARKDKEKNGYI
ncbi:hypothetical protein PFUGPA_05350 [Plasmodium falciparum Palo Alto/Uganda]|uniref:Plasmodium RESA N-terminal domain-containing protein n=2 Tax=Plasmodium falciparum TaxID=5833 RepID=W4IQU5_PLAFP|nr:hypothetical protein PFUGPA_05350 [Plasmodium falciparum Palo Alto/Uganda]ETW62125.1 hypothetical protein PFMC_02226 [Plasmodium falciparum CAMP/Malaysia]